MINLILCFQFSTQASTDNISKEVQLSRVLLRHNAAYNLMGGGFSADNLAPPADLCVNSKLPYKLLLCFFAFEINFVVFILKIIKIKVKI